MVFLVNNLCARLFGACGFSIKHYICFRPYILPVIVGLCLGITIHMMFVPFLEESCEVNALRQAAESRPVRQINAKQVNPKDSFEPEEKFEARIIQPIDLPKNVSVNKNAVKPKLVRPRYISTELGIREKLFVGVLSSESSLGTFGVAMSKTVAKYVTKLIFFSARKPSEIPTDLPMVTFNEKHTQFLPIHMLKYLSEHYAETYDYYLFVSDRTYLRGEKFLDLVEHISVAEDVYMGVPNIDQTFCNLEGGVILSQSMMSKVWSGLNWCFANPHRDSASATLGRCLHHGTQRMCSARAGGKTFTSMWLNDFDYDDDIRRLKTDLKFNQSLSLYPMPDDTSLYKMHRYFCRLELEKTRLEIESLKKEIIDKSQYAPKGRDSLTWPIGANEPYKPTSRFGVINWIYFTETHLYLNDELTNIQELTEVDKRDIQEVLQLAMAQLDAKYNHQFQLQRLVNGYRHFDPTRGMEYIVDLLLKDKSNRRTESLKRVHLLRPLGKVELVPMPYVTENAKINMVLFLHPTQVDMFDIFLDGYVRSCLRTGEEIQLIVLFLYTAIPTQMFGKDEFARPKTAISNMSNKYGKEGKISWRAVDRKLSDVAVMDDLVSEFQPDALVLTVTVNMEFSSDLMVQYLNRIRMNTLKGTQVNFPMGFWQFKPNLIYNKRPPPSVEIGQRLGRYDTDSFEHSSFYTADYKTARKRLSPVDAKTGDIASVFLNYKKLHIFRAVEPSLKLKWMNLTCDPSLTTADKYQLCLSRRAEGLASQHHLALLIYEQRNEGILQAGEEKSKSVDKNVKTSDQAVAKR